MKVLVIFGTKQYSYTRGVTANSRHVRGSARITADADPRGSAQISAERTADRGFSAESDNFRYKTELIINNKNEFLDQIHQVSICNYVELKLP